LDWLNATAESISAPLASWNARHRPFCRSSAAGGLVEEKLSYAKNHA